MQTLRVGHLITALQSLDVNMPIGVKMPVATAVEGVVSLLLETHGGEEFLVLRTTGHTIAGIDEEGYERCPQNVRMLVITL